MAPVSTTTQPHNNVRYLLRCFDLPEKGKEPLAQQEQMDVVDLDPYFWKLLSCAWSKAFSLTGNGTQATPMSSLRMQGSSTSFNFQRSQEIQMY